MVSRAVKSDEREMAHWGLSGADLPGVRPASQARSRQVEVRLLQAGHALLDGRPLDTLSIESVCAKAHCSVGGFYRRFDSKEAFFAAIQHLVCRRRDEDLTGLVASVGGDWTLDRKCTALAADLVGWYRDNFGVLRASLHMSANGDNAWRPMMELGYRHKAIWYDLLQHDLPDDLDAEEQRTRISFANQVVNGTLINMILNDPGPVHLSEDRCIADLAAVMRGYLTVG